MAHDKDVPPEEKEKWSLDRERDADALGDYMKVERVIGVQKDEDGNTEYYVKCMSPFLVTVNISYSHEIRERTLLRFLHMGIR